MTTTPAPLTTATVLTKVVAGVVGAVAVAAAAWGGFLIAIGFGETADEDSLAGLAVVIGVVVVVLALPVLGLCAAVVISRNRTVVGVCGLLLAATFGVVTFLALVAGGSMVATVGLLVALAMAASSVLSLGTLAAPATWSA